jgi:hypothetical protein
MAAIGVPNNTRELPVLTDQRQALCDPKLPVTPLQSMTALLEGL